MRPDAKEHVTPPVPQAFLSCGRKARRPVEAPVELALQPNWLHAFTASSKGVTVAFVTVAIFISVVWSLLAFTKISVGTGTTTARVRDKEVSLIVPYPQQPCRMLNCHGFGNVLNTSSTKTKFPEARGSVV